MVKAWNVNWNGHEILAENRWLGGEKLYINGICCDARSGLGFTSDLRGDVRDAEGVSHMVTAKFRQSTFCTKVLCHIFVGHEWIGGDPV